MSLMLHSLEKIFIFIYFESNKKAFYQFTFHNPRSRDHTLFLPKAILIINKEILLAFPCEASSIHKVGSESDIVFGLVNVNQVA